MNMVQDTRDLPVVVAHVLAEGIALAREHLQDIPLKLDYVTVYARTSDEYTTWCAIAEKLGSLRQQRDAGNVYYLSGMTPSIDGTRLLMIHQPSSRLWSGYVDFAIDDVADHWPAIVRKPGVAELHVPHARILEITNYPKYDAAVYIPDSPLSHDLSVPLPGFTLPGNSHAQLG